MNKILTTISKYRTALMGIAILGVMIGHLKIGWPATIFSKIVGMFCYSIFTGGFLFLSGFGLYYSMNKNNSAREFYKKRIKRVLVPWLCIAFPYFVYMDLVVFHSINNFFWHITTLSFWKSGNYSGMWYISVILALYLIYPWYHKFVYNKEGQSKTYTLLVMFGILLAVEYYLFKYLPDYYERIGVCMNMGLFFIGSHMAAMTHAEYKCLVINMGGGDINVSASRLCL